MSNDVLAQFGVSGENLSAHTEPAKPYPVPVLGRVAHIDADFMAYQAACDRKDELDGTKPRKTVPEKCERAKQGLEHLMRACAATNFIAHITPSGSDKGGRSDYAVTKPYQGNRADREKPEHLDQLRAYISTLSSKIHLDQEADDGMAQANYQALASGRSNLSVIVSKDKDLRMVPGLHYDFDTEQVVSVGDPFGWLWIDDTKSSKTLKGWGTKFFWAQCLMGDTADNIAGLPYVTQGALADLGHPDGESRRLETQYQKARTPARRLELETMVEASGWRLKKIGAMLTFALLGECNNDQECYKLIKFLFQDLDKCPTYDFIDYKTGEPCTGTQALFGDMLLLWMRRQPDKLDVLYWLKEERIV